MSKIRDLILAADDQQYELVACPEWGVDVEVHGMNAGERGRFFAAAAGKDGKINQETYFVDLIIQTAHEPGVVGEDGVSDMSGPKVFSLADRDSLLKKSGVVIQRLGNAAANLSGLGAREEAKEALKEIPSSEGTSG